MLVYRGLFGVSSLLLFSLVTIVVAESIVAIGAPTMTTKGGSETSQEPEQRYEYCYYRAKFAGNALANPCSKSAAQQRLMLLVKPDG